MSHVPFSLQDALGERYTVDGELGSGGMARVYLAQDHKHARQVAVKVLNPELAATVGVDRFLKEIETVAQLRHPHILPLHDSGRAGDTLFYLMPYLHEGSLRDRLMEVGRLSVGEAVRIAIEVGEALAVAHRAGLVHRDIKPENIMLDDGHAVVTDFGIALAFSSSEAERLTRTGLTVGTAEYMSPEQASGEADIDGRSDVYSLAVVLYEMLAGETPFAGPNPRAVFAKRMAGDPTPIAEVRPEVPTSVAGALARATATDPADRFETVDGFVEALRTSPPIVGAAIPVADDRIRLGRVATAGIAVLAVVAGLYWSSTSRAPAAGEPVQRLAVLPLGNLLSDDALTYLVDATHEQVIHQLWKIAALEVISPSTVRTYREQGAPVTQIVDELELDAVVEGSVYAVADSLRINLQVSNYAGELQWSGEFGGPLRQVMQIQGEAAAAVAGEIAVGITPGEQARLEQTPTVDLEAFEAFVLGREAFRTGGPPGLTTALEYMDRAVRIAPEFALAHAFRGRIWLIMSESLGIDARRGVAAGNAFQAATRALELDSTVAAGYEVLAHHAYDYDYEWERAETLFRRGLELDPSDPAIHQTYGAYLIAMRRFQEADRHMRRAASLDPLTPFWASSIGWVPFGEGRYEKAIEHFDRTIERFPDAHLSRGLRAAALAGSGRFEQLVEENGPLVERLPARGQALVAYAYGKTGNAEEARRIAEDLVARRVRDYVGPVVIATAVAGYGTPEDVLEWLELAYEERAAALAHLREFVFVEAAVRQHPRYQTLLEKMAFPG